MGRKPVRWFQIVVTYSEWILCPHCRVDGRGMDCVIMINRKGKESYPSNDSLLSSYLKVSSKEGACEILKIGNKTNNKKRKVSPSIRYFATRHVVTSRRDSPFW